MPTLDATPKSTTANSYVTLAEADTYFDQRLNSGNWTDATTDAKERALITATNRIDTERFRGYKTLEGSALKWPREDVVDDDGEEYDTDTIPRPVKQATYELALTLLNDGATDRLQDTGLEEYDRVKVGELEVERNRSFDAGQLPSNVERLLRPVIATTSNTATLWLA